MDAEDYSSLPLGQYEEDNILRELNKCLLGFQQKQTRWKEVPLSKSRTAPQQQQVTSNHRGRRLSPIGESLSSANSECQLGQVPIVTQDSCSTRHSLSPMPDADASNLRVDSEEKCVRLQKQASDLMNEGGMFHNRRGKFIVLGSSGELLPVKRKPESGASLDSSEDEFHSAKTSLENGTDSRN